MITFIQNNLIAIISIAISIISLLISSIFGLRTLCQERFDIDFSLVKWFGASPRDYPFFLWLNIQNNSKLPISIREISLRFIRNDTIVTAVGNGNKKLVASQKQSHGKESEIYDTYSLDYPVFIEGFGSIGGYFHVFSIAEYWAFEDFNVDVTLHTNRGNKTKTIFFDFGKNVLRVIQRRNGDCKIQTRSDGSNIDFILDSDL